MQVRISPKKAVCPSVKRVDCDKTKENSAQFLYRVKEHLSKLKNGWLHSDLHIFYLYH